MVSHTNERFQAINWAVEEEVDIISMGWFIEKDTTSPFDADDRLRRALQTAMKKNIIIFCANPDRGPSFRTNDTYPRALDTDQVFCIGAATRDGVRWGQIDAQDQSCDYFLPGVELGIQVESVSRKNQNDPPREWCGSLLLFVKLGC